MPVDHRSPQIEHGRRKWDCLGQLGNYKGWLLIVIPLASLLMAAVLPVRGATLVEALRAGMPFSRRLAPQAVAWSSFQPAGWVTTLPMTSTVTAQAPGGLDPVAANYSLSTDAGNSWSAWSAAGLTVTGTVSTTQELTVVALNFPDSNSADLIRFRINEISGTLETSPSYTVRVDTIPPTSNVTYPTAGAVLNAAPSIRGAATDGSGSGVNQVSISVRNNTSGLYWNGTGWGSAEQFLVAVGTTTWTYNGAQPTWTDGAAYTVRSRAADIAGNLETPGSGITFTYDTAPPSVKLTAPNGGEIWAGGRPYTVTWTVTDTIGLPSTPITLSVSYDGGANWSTLAGNLPNTGSYIWTTPATANTSQALVQVDATDRAGNRSSDRSDAPFTIDSDPPAAPLNLTANPAGWTKVADFAVTWTNPPDVSPVAGAWYKLDAPPTAPHDGAYITGTTTITGIKPTADGAHPIYVWLQDTLGRANQNAYATTTLSLDRTPPPPPYNLSGNPARRWTNINEFDELWINPADVSGIVAAYYRLDQPGSFPTDGTVISTTNTLTDIPVTGDGKHDLYIWLVDAAGNVSHLNRNVDPQVFWYDSTPPTSTLSVALAPPLVAIGGTATDGVNSGVNQVRVSMRNNTSGFYWNGTGWGSAEQFLVAVGTTTWTYTGTQPTWTDGAAYTVRSRAADVAGNLETPGSGITFTYDTTPPSVKLTAPNGGEIWAGGRPYTVTWTVTDTIGLPSTPITLSASYDGGANWAIIAGNLPNTDSYVWTLPATLNTKQALVQVEVTNILGYRGSDRSDASFTIDSDPPAAPLNLTANPAGWTKIPDFAVTWTNPPDVSPVAGAWYKLDTPPTAPHDGAYITGATTITGIKPTADAAHPIYVWLQDTLGRANQNAYATTTLMLDRTAPSAPSGLTGNPARRWTNINSFTETWINPPDVSGIVGAYYRLDQPGSFPTDGTLVYTTSTLTNIAVTGDGKHDLYIWLVDAAGNVDHINRNLDPQVFWFDSSPPTSTLSVALAPPLVAIGGTATDGANSGVNQVSISVRNNTSGLYWDGTGWGSAEQFLVAAGTATWAYTGAQPTWTDGAAYTVRSRAADVAGNLETPGSGITFTYDTTPPSVKLTAPNGGEIWAGGRPYTVTWTVTDTIGLPSTPITLSASYDGGANWAIIAGNLPNTNSYVWTLPATPNTKQALVQVEVTNILGYRGSDRSDAPFTIDSDPPAAPLNLTANPAGWTNVADFAVTWTNPPDVSPVAGAWYKLDTPPTAPHDGAYITGATTITGIKPTADAAHPIYVWLQDTLGRTNQNAYATTTLMLDRTAPSPPSGLTGNPARRWTNINRFNETWINPPDVSGIVGAYYRLDQPGSFPTDGTLVYTTSTLMNIAVTGDGKHDLYIWLLDAAGNADHINRNLDPQVFWFDGTPPTSTVLLDPPLPSSGWYTTTVSVTFQGQDPPGGSGLDAVRHRVDDGPWEDAVPAVQIAAEGPHTIRYYAIDVAGNRDATKELQLALDLTPPAVTLTAARPPEATGWYTASVAFTLTLTDTLSGSSHGYYRLDRGAWQAGDHFQVANDGDHTIEYYGQDAAGNRSTVTSLKVQMDTTAPTTAYQIEGTQGQNGWYTSPLTVRLIAADSGSGIAATYYRVNNGSLLPGTQFQLTSDGDYTLSFYSVDAAGNIEESSFPVQAKIDTVAPGTPQELKVSPDTWTRVNRFSVQWANLTDRSGIAGAYYRLDSEPTSPTDGTFSPQINRLDGITVPDEGVHHLFVWLRDVAGNVDQHNRVESPPLRYDATPPKTTAAIEGVAGTDGWYRSPVTVTLRTTDQYSGVEWLRLSYRLDEGAWSNTTATTASFNVVTSGKHVLEFAAEDKAGNVEKTNRMTLSIDTDPPAAPIDLRAEPVGWQRYNGFRLLWDAPLDESGIAGAYVKFDAPPASQTDGVFHAGTETVEGLQVPGEGKHDVHAWLRDRAGNSDNSTAVALPGALWYDGTPPATTITQTGSLGLSGWYVEPVSFAMSATDAASGLAAIRYQVDDGAWVSGDSLTVEADGMHVVRIASVDVAGNEEPTRDFYVNIDRQAPRARMGALSRYQPQPSFEVSWQGSDPAPGSGLATFDVQVRDGYQGAWQSWFTRTTKTNATYTGQRGHTYFFRVAAQDVAGNRQPFTGDDTYVVIETVLNGSFDTGTFGQWTANIELSKAVVPATGPSGSTALVARLGSEHYGPSLTDPGSVPVGSATIWQTIRVPDLSQLPHPTLTFWYRVLTYDVMYSKTYERWQDTLDVDLYDQAGQLLVHLLRAGNPSQVYGQLYDTGWKWATIDLRPYAGQTVQLSFSNWNRYDNLFNTWSYVDDVRVLNWPLYSTYLSFVTGGGSGGAAAAAAEQSDEAIPPAVSGDAKR